MHDVQYTTVVKWFEHGNPISSFKSDVMYINNITRFNTGVYSCGVMKNKQYGSGNVFITVLCTYTIT